MKVMTTPGLITHRELDHLVGGRRRRQRWQARAWLPQGHRLRRYQDQLTIFPEFVLAHLVLDRNETALRTRLNQACDELLEQARDEGLVDSWQQALDQCRPWHLRLFAERAGQLSNGDFSRWRELVDGTVLNLGDEGVTFGRHQARVAGRNNGSYDLILADGEEVALPNSVAACEFDVGERVVCLGVRAGASQTTYVLPQATIEFTTGSEKTSPATPTPTDKRAQNIAIEAARASDSPDRFTAVALWARDRLNDLVPPAGSSAQHAYLKRVFSQATSAGIDYERHAGAFARSFFLINYWKTVVALREQVSQPFERVIDLGCGSGATTLAALAWLSQQPRASRCEVVLVDRSRAQLALAQELIARAVAELGLPATEISVIEADLAGSSEVSLEGDLVLLGHLLTENRSQVKPVLDRARQMTSAGGHILALERDDDEVWGEVQEVLGKIALPRSMVQRSFAAFPTRLNEDLPVDGEGRLRLRYLRLRVPQAKARVATVERYFRAWEEHDAGALGEVFSDAASYSFDPFQPPAYGLSEIRQYWEREVLPQAATTTAITAIAYSPDDAFIEWEARFARAEHAVRVIGVMIVTFTTDGERLSSLREYYRSEKLALTA
jgi:SAM-dependent methyltransferase